MHVRQFASEAYPLTTRGEAWRALLAGLQLRSDQTGPAADAFALATAIGEEDGAVLARLTLSPQRLSPLGIRPRMPLAIVALDDSLPLETGGAPSVLPAGNLAILPAAGPWELVIERTARLLVFCAPETLFHGRRAAFRPLSGVESFAPKGMAAVFIRALEAAAADLEQLSLPHWQALEQMLTDLLLSLTVAADTAEGAATPGLAALFNRVTLTIERRLQDADLTAGRIARLEGISERYLQRLFEQNGESFTHYLRERRLQRAKAALATPGDVRLPVADVAFQCGFGDAANFSRLFKERFGLPPGAYRNRQSGLHQAGTGGVEQRGWPVQALGARKPAVPASAGENDTAEAAPVPARESRHHRLPLDVAHVHWGYFSRLQPPVLEIRSGDTVEVETLSQHASDAPELMIRGDAAAEAIFHWTRDSKAIDRRGAGPLDASIFGRGAGEGFGVHICCGPIYVRDAEPGDVIEVRIDDMRPRPSQSPGHEGRVFGSNVAAWWGYHHKDLIEEPKPRETVTIYEILEEEGSAGFARALYSYRWTPQTDPFGVVHRTYDYPGVLVAPETIEPVESRLSDVRIPLRPHFGVIALAPREADLVDSVPPAYFGGNLDNWRLGRGSSVYLPVSVAGGLLSIGDPHAAQGDGELGGTAIECSMTGRFTVTLHRKGGRFSGLTYPLIETSREWILTGFSHPNYLAEFGVKGQGEVYAKSSLDLAMKDAFRKARRFLMETHGLGEDEAISLMSAAVDFSVTQVVDGNWGIHAVIPKALFTR